MPAIQGARTLLANVGAIASATYLQSSVYDATVRHPLDVILEVAINQANAPAGDYQVLVYVKASLDNSNWQSGPSGGVSDTDVSDLTYVGAVPINSIGTHRQFFSVGQALGFIPGYFVPVLKNVTGVSTAVSGSSIYTAEITGA